MKKYIIKRYIIKYADGREQNVMQAIHESRKEATKTIMDYLGDNEDYCLSPFDFILEEVECEDVNEVITDFESAKKVLSNESNSKVTIEIKDVTELVTDVSPKHIDALIALNKLFTIAEAWNKEDGFVPDFSDWEQDKWFPWFKYNKDVAEFVCADTINAATAASAHLGSRLCFKTKTRAEQFGKQFEDLYNKVFL